MLALLSHRLHLAAPAPARLRTNISCDDTSYLTKSMWGIAEALRELMQNLTEKCSWKLVLDGKELNHSYLGPYAEGTMAGFGIDARDSRVTALFYLARRPHAAHGA